MAGLLEILNYIVDICSRYLLRMCSALQAVGSKGEERMAGHVLEVGRGRGVAGWSKPTLLLNCVNYHVSKGWDIDVRVGMFGALF